jgi:hypothetical protein
MIEIPGNASVSSGVIGPHISGEVAVTTIGMPSTLAALANATTLCFSSATGMSLTPSQQANLMVNEKQCGIFRCERFRIFFGVHNFV